MVAIRIDNNARLNNKMIINEFVDIAWKTSEPLEIEDPLYDVLLHLVISGSISLFISDGQKLFTQLTEFDNNYTEEYLASELESIVTFHVKDCISKIVSGGMLSYFMINAHLIDITNVIREKLETVFSKKGVVVQHFNIEAVEAPETDYQKVSEANERRSKRFGS